MAPNATNTITTQKKGVMPHHADDGTGTAVAFKIDITIPHQKINDIKTDIIPFIALTSSV